MLAANVLNAYANQLVPSERRTTRLPATDEFATKLIVSSDTPVSPASPAALNCMPLIMLALALVTTVWLPEVFARMLMTSHWKPAIGAGNVVTKPVALFNSTCPLWSAAVIDAVVVTVRVALAANDATFN